jgi:hypothetical protein
MPFAVTAQGRAALAAARKGDPQHEDEVPVDENGRRISPLQAAQRAIAEDEASDADEPSTVKRVNLPGAAGPLSEAMAAHAAQRTTPHPLATLQTTAAPGLAGPTFAPGTATVQAQNHRAPGPAFPQVHEPGQPAFHAAPTSPESHE